MADQALRRDGRHGGSTLRRRVQADLTGRALDPCRWCGRDLGVVDVACGPGPNPNWRCVGPNCLACNGTGRVVWPWQDRLVLMAYAGHEEARGMVPRPPWDCAATWSGVDVALSFVDWLRGLDREPGASLVAAIGAGRAVLSTLRDGYTPCPAASNTAHASAVCPNCDARRRERNAHRQAENALDAATDHAHCGCEASREAWHKSSVLQGCPNWVVQPWDSQINQREEYGVVFGYAARETDEATIRRAVQATLTRWGEWGIV